MKTHFENIDPWFENARSQDPVISREEVLNQLQSGATGAGKGISSGSTLYIFSAAGLLLIVICGVLFFSPKYNSETLPPASGQESEKIGTKRPVNGDSITSAINEPEKSKSGFYYSPVDADPLFLLRDTYIKDERFRPANSEITIPAQEESIKKHVRNKPQEYLNLSYSDLENLGIYTNGHVLKYRNITDSIIEADGSKKYLYMNIDVEPHGSISYNINDEVKNQAEFSNSRPFRPLFVVSLIDTQLIKVDFLVREIYDEAYFDVTHEYLVPVNVKLNPAPGKSGPFSHSRDLIFWFLPTEELFKAISPYSKLSYDPSALQKIADARTDILNKQKSDLGKTILTEKQQAEINKRKLILTPEELIRLGFKVTAKTIKYQNTVMHNNVPASLKIDISKKGTYSETIMDNPYLQLSGRSRPFYPVCMSDAGLTNKTFFYFDLRNKKQSVMQSSKDASERFYKSIDSLVPISISVKGMAEFRNPVVFWFPITEDFLNALPESAIEHLVIAKGLGETFEKSTQRKVDLSAINLIQLTTDQLQNIGVTQFTSEGILVAMSAFGKDTQV